MQVREKREEKRDEISSKCKFQNAKLKDKGFRMHDREKDEEW